MNEQVKLLVKQAEQYAVNEAHETDDDDFTYEASFQEKFAELIVQNIVDGLRVHANTLEGTGNDNVMFVLRTHASGIEQQFGVKE